MYANKIGEILKKYKACTVNQSVVVLAKDWNGSDSD